MCISCVCCVVYSDGVPKAGWLLSASCGVSLLPSPKLLLLGSSMN